MNLENFAIAMPWYEPRPISMRWMRPKLPGLGKGRPGIHRLRLCRAIDPNVILFRTGACLDRKRRRVSVSVATIDVAQTVHFMKPHHR